jgi:hypothetical protein
MKVFFIGSAVMAVVWALAFLPKPSAAQQSSDSSHGKQESPFACNRFGLTPEERKRHFDVLGPMLRSLRTGVRELENGYEFQFPSDRATFQLLAEWSIQERLCCPFFDIELRLEREGGPLWLRLTGREGTKEFIKADFPAVWFTG